MPNSLARRIERASIGKPSTLVHEPLECGDDLFAVFLRRVAAGLVQRVDQAQVGVDLRRGQRMETHPGFLDEAHDLAPRGTGQAHAGIHLVPAARERGQHRGGGRQVGRFAERAAIKADEGVRAEHGRARVVRPQGGAFQPGVEKHEFAHGQPFVG